MQTQCLTDNNLNHIIYVNESLLTHNVDIHTWIVCLWKTNTDEISSEITTNKNENILKRMAEKHLGFRNTIYSDSCQGYNFLNREEILEIFIPFKNKMILHIF